MTPIFPATIRSGKLYLDKAEQFKDYLRSFADEKRVEVIVEKVTHQRSIPQNRFFHGVTCKVISDSTGNDLEVVKAFLKQEYGAKIFFGNKWVPKPTHLMDTIEMMELCEKSRVWAAEEMGIIIPQPEGVKV